MLRVMPGRFNLAVTMKNLAFTGEAESDPHVGGDTGSRDAFAGVKGHDVTCGTTSVTGLLLRWSDPQESSGALRRSAGRVTEGTMVEKQCRKELFVHLRHLAQRKHDVFTIATA